MFFPALYDQQVLRYERFFFFFLLACFCFPNTNKRLREKKSGLVNFYHSWIHVYRLPRAIWQSLPANKSLKVFQECLTSGNLILTRNDCQLLEEPLALRRTLLPPSWVVNTRLDSLSHQGLCSPHKFTASAK